MNYSHKGGYSNVSHKVKDCLNHVAEMCMLNVILNKSQSKS